MAKTGRSAFAIADGRVSPICGHSLMPVMMARDNARQRDKPDIRCAWMPYSVFAAGCIVV